MERTVMKHAGLAFAAGLSLVLLGCSQKAPAPAPAAESATAAAAGTAAASSWTPEALEELAAPIALYPDDILGHLLTAATNPQEVLDAGNWLLENQKLSGKSLDQAASKLGMSTSMRALIQFPETVDMMCMNIEWTTRLGQAFMADQGAVLAAVQRLRAQAQSVGNLKTAGPLKVEEEKQGDQTVIVVQPADPKVIYVPQYDPVAVYAPPPAVIPPPAAPVAAAAPAATTTTVVQEGHSTGALITTGLLAFGAGMLVNEVFNDDDDYYRYQPNYGYGGMYYGGRPYYPPPPGMYRPPYGGGYYPAHGYTRPPNYQHGFNNNTIVVNNQGSNYWNQNRRDTATTLPARSPITAAKPNRPELAGLDRDAGARRTQPAAQKPDWKGQPGYNGKPAASGAKPAYNGARPEYQGARDNMVQNSARPNAPATPGQRPQGSYAGAKDRPAAPQAAARPTAKAPVQRPTGAADRGRDATPALAGGNAAQNRPNVSRPQQNRAAEAAPAAVSNRTPPSRPQAANRDAFSGGGNAATERAASDRGHASMAASKSAGRPAAKPAAAPAAAGGKKARR